MTPLPRLDWIAALRSHLANCFDAMPIPPRNSLSHIEELQCRILGGHLISWLEKWGPEMIQERSFVALSPEQKCEPHVVILSSGPGLTAANEILSPLSEQVSFCRRSDYEEFCANFPDVDFLYHCCLESRFEVPARDHEDRLREQYQLQTGEIWIHYDCSTMAPLFARGGRHLWHYDGDSPRLVAEAYETWVS